VVVSRVDLGEVADALVAAYGLERSVGPSGVVEVESAFSFT
jgi:hypothetical protein